MVLGSAGRDYCKNMVLEFLAEIFGYVSSAHLIIKNISLYIYLTSLFQVTFYPFPCYSLYESLLLLLLLLLLLIIVPLSSLSLLLSLKLLLNLLAQISP